VCAADRRVPGSTPGTMPPPPLRVGGSDDRRINPKKAVLVEELDSRYSRMQGKS